MKKESAAYLLARLPIGMSMLGHGIVRIPKLDKFSGYLVEQFDKSFLPASLVQSFGYVLPWVELLIGILLILGLFTRFACVLGVFTIVGLIFGSTMIEEWDHVSSQMVYGVYFALLYHFADHNYYSVDKLLKRT